MRQPSSTALNARPSPNISTVRRVPPGTVSTSMPGSRSTKICSISGSSPGASQPNQRRIRDGSVSARRTTSTGARTNVAIWAGSDALTVGHDAVMAGRASWKKLREPLPRPRRRDQVVMVGALAASALVLIASLAAVMWVAMWSPWLAAFYVIALGGGWMVATINRPHPRPGSDRVEQRVRVALIRLCVVADMPTPQIRIWRALPALSWTTQMPFGRPRVHVTEAMVRHTDDRGLEAVLAHEMAHIANGDAPIMTVLAGPAMAILTAFWTLRRVANTGWGLAVMVVCGLAVPPALLLMGLGRCGARGS